MSQNRSEDANPRAMKNIFILLLFFPICAWNQPDLNTPCPLNDCSCMLAKADALVNARKPDFERALNLYFAAKACDPKLAKEAEDKIVQLFAKVEALRLDAEEKARLIKSQQSQLEKEKRDALLARDEARKEKDAANAARDTARLATEQAQKERDNAQAALDRLEESNARVVNLLLQNAEKDILKLDYELGLEKIKAAAALNASKTEVAKAYLELAFWFGETGYPQRAVGILDSAAQLVNNTEFPALLQNLPQDTAAARQKLRDAIRLFDKSTFDTLWARYYPVMVDVEGGTFQMGSGSGDEKLHSAKVSNFQIAKYETTWWQYALFCKATGRQYESPGWGTDGNNPVVNVSWYDARDYGNWLSRRMGYEEAMVQDEEGRDSLVLGANGFRLPTEAEWEYAARGGKHKSPFTYAGSDVIDEVAWYNKNSGSRTQAVGKLKYNALRLHDMSGNVREWCWDWFGPYPESPPLDYIGPTKPSDDNYVGSNRVLRGGPWYDNADFARCSYRSYDYPGFRFDYVGFRLARTGGQ